MDGGEAVQLYNGILLSQQKDEIMPFTATWMDLEIIILSEVKLSHNMAYIRNLKGKDTNELIYERETDSHTQITNLW